MSPLKDEDRLAKAMAEAFAAVVTRAAVRAAMRIKGADDFRQAREKLSGMTVHTELIQALENIVPPSSGNLALGADFIKDDLVWREALAKLGDWKFEKRGMASYFLRYLQAMANTQQILNLKRLADEKTAGLDLVRKRLLNGMLEEHWKESDNLLSALFGYLRMVREQIPADPENWKAKVAVRLWKMANGAELPEYETVIAAADEFLAKSAGNTRISELAKR